jgi:hypothetical protein
MTESATVVEEMNKQAEIFRTNAAVGGISVSSPVRSL